MFSPTSITNYSGIAAAYFCIELWTSTASSSQFIAQRSLQMAVA